MAATSGCSGDSVMQTMIIWVLSTICGSMLRAADNGPGLRAASRIRRMNTMAGKATSPIKTLPGAGRVPPGGKTNKETCGYLVVSAQTDFIAIYGYTIRNKMNGHG